VPQADFYLLKQGPADRLMQTACRLAAKAVAAGQTVFIQTADAAQTAALDEWLWSFPAESFLPHQSCDEPGNLSAPVLLGLKLTTPERDICLNVSGKPVEQPARFPRILELFPADEPSRRAARERWQHYKQTGFVLNHHEV